MTEPQNTPEQGAEQVRDTGGVIDLTAQIAARDPGLAERIAALESAVKAERAPREPDPVVRTGTVPLSSIDPSPPPPLIVGRLAPESGHTILFGMGGIGKGTIAAAWAVDMVKAGHRLLIVDLEDNPREWSQRIVGLGGADIAHGLSYVRPYAPGWQGARGSMEQMADDLRETADQLGADVLIVDSAGMAGGKPEDAEAAISYGRALQRIGRVTLTLAHVGKASDMQYPFGSIYWHNLARVTWSISPYSEEPGFRTVVLRNPKANGYAKETPALVTISYDNPHDSRGLPRDVLVRSYGAVLADRIAEVLAAATEPMSVPQIVDVLADDEGGDQVKADSVRHTLRYELKRTAKRWTVTGQGKAARWSKV